MMLFVQSAAKMLSPAPSIQVQLWLPVLWMNSRTCSWDADDMSIKSESLSTAHH